MNRQMISYVDDTPSIDIRDFRPVPGAKFVFKNPDGVHIGVTWTDCNLGGKRPWFRCPRCNHRCKKLYRFVCRICSKLRYRCKSENPRDRAIRRAIRHREKFGQVEGGLMVSFPSRPRGMSWQKYFAGWNECNRLDQIVFRLFIMPEPIVPRSAIKMKRGNQRGTKFFLSQKKT
jgi:hypothetical protein